LRSREAHASGDRAVARWLLPASLRRSGGRWGTCDRFEALAGSLTPPEDIMDPTTPLDPPQRPDPEILDSIRIAVDWQLFSELALTVIGGIVTIDGNVDSWSERRNLDTVVRQIDGVRNVVNHLTVRAPPIGEATIRIAIEQALARRAMREAGRIDLAIAGARVTVIGTVRSFGEHDAVIGALISTPSVESIDDQLEVQGLHPGQ
jgi:hypothetical protein